MILGLSVGFALIWQHFNYQADLIDAENQMIERYCEKTRKTLTIGETVKVVYKCGSIEKVKE